MKIQSFVRIIGIIDLVTSVLLSAISFMFAAFIAYWLVSMLGDVTEKISILEMIVFSYILCKILCLLIPALMASFTFISKVFASWNLIKAAEEEADSRDAKRLCIIWQKITAVSVVLMILFYAYSVSLVKLIEEVWVPPYAIISQIVALCIVEQYKRQLTLRPSLVNNNN